MYILIYQSSRAARARTLRVAQDNNNSRKTVMNK